MKAYEIITDQIIEKLEQGVVPWQKPWYVNNQRPMNFVTKREYRGINVLLTVMQDYASPYWVTIKQVNNLGGHIIKGEKATKICFWKWLERKVENEDPGETEMKKVPMLRYYNVWNIEQCELPDKVLDKIPAPTVEIDFDPIAEAEAIINNMPQRPEILFKGQQAYYSPSKDIVVLPRKKTFKTEVGYYSTAFHELVHSTGHEKRLNRFKCDEETLHSPVEKYAREELVAELGTTFLCSECGIIDREFDNSAAYINSWLKKLKEDKSMIITAGQQADKAVRFITNNQYEEEVSQ